MTARSSQRQRLQDLLDPVVSAAGYELVDISVTAAGRRSVVRVVVDGDAGIDLDAVADVSRSVSDALDANEDAFPGQFVLEVSSPGVDRPLTEPRLWRRALDRLVSVSLNDVDEPIVGRVRQLDDDGVTLEVDGTSTHHPWSQVGTGQVQVEFNRSGQRPGQQGTPDDDDLTDDDLTDDELTEAQLEEVAEYEDEED